MRYSKYFITVLSAFALIACTDNDLIEGPTPPVPDYDATLSLAIKGQGKLHTKAMVAQNHPDFIKRLTIAVYQAGSLVTVKDTVNTSGVSGIEEIKVPAGSVSLQIYANLEGDTYTTDNFPEILSLSDEKNGNLKMNSGILPFDLAPGHNYIGYGAKGQISVDHNGMPVSGLELQGDSIKLTRYISRVHLSGLTFKLSDNFSEGVASASFQLDTIFFANVKSQSLLSPNGSSYEQTTNPTFLYGACADSLGQYKADNTNRTFMDWLNYDFKSDVRPSPFVKYVFDQSFEYTSVSDSKKTFSWTVENPLDTYILSSGKSHIGSYAYVYENSDAQNPTLIVLKGQYSVTYKSGTTALFPNRYYAVVVNDPATNQGFIGGAIKHDYIQRNNIYDLKLTISGPGSEKPYTPQSTAHISAEVTVKAWNVIEQSEEVD